MSRDEVFGEFALAIDLDIALRSVCRTGDGRALAIGDCILPEVVI